MRRDELDMGHCRGAGKRSPSLDEDWRPGAPKRRRVDTPENRQLYAAQYAELQQLETKAGAPVS